MKYLSSATGVLLSLLVSVSVYSNLPQTLSEDICSTKLNADIVGTALDKKTGKFLYCEYHFFDAENARSTVEYTDFQQTLIVKKELDYSDSLLSPNVRQTDFRHGEKRLVSSQTGKSGYLLQYLGPNANSQNMQEKLINKTSSLVIDAGFDHFIRQQWEILVKGEPAKMSFAVLPSLRIVKLTTRLKKKTRCGGQLYDQQKYYCFYVNPSTSIVAWLVKPITLLYDKTSQQLLNYTGLVNITSDRGKSLRAVITYRYDSK